MDQADIFVILNQYVFASEKAYLVRNIAENSERFVGVFRSTTPGLKLIQNLLQSREIRFGDALEVIVRELIADLGYVNLPRSVKMPDGKKKDLDQYFSDKESTRFYLVEQKVRDDHDSSKKTGQVDNFRQKLMYLKEIHGNSLTGIVYFIDPALTKNANYYSGRFQGISKELEIPIHLFYNGAFFQYLSGESTTWDLLERSLLAWRDTLPTQISLDCDVPDALEELMTVEPLIWHRLAINDQLWSGGVVQSVFPRGTNLREIARWLADNPITTFQYRGKRLRLSVIGELLQERISAHYT